MRALLALTAILLFALPAAADTDLSRDQVKEIVRELIREEPELVLEALQTLQDRERAQEEANRRQQMSALEDQLRRQPQDPVLGNPDGEIVLVEFFDYACGYCKRIHPVLKEAVERRGNIRWVMKEFPILGENSVLAARFSLAASKLGNYQAFHDALMSHRGRLGPGAMQRAAETAGIDFENLQQVAQEPWVEQTIARNHQLAQALGIRGTPYMFVGDETVPGFVDADQLEEILVRVEAEG
ncbi:MAG: DsbA family protein [Alphaproteobacteria bacterium]|nr:DsbA family protein [Alphaproteobacteria bacterium]